MISITNTILTFLTCISLIFISGFAFLDMMDMYGREVKLFHYSKNKRKKEYQRIEKTVDEYIRNNNALIKNNSQTIANVILQSMGLNSASGSSLISKVEDLRRANRVIQNVGDMNGALKNLILMEDVVVNLERTVPGRKAIYPTLKYYINLTDNIEKFPVKNTALNILYFYIESELKKNKMKVADIDKIVIPTESNTVMGIALAKMLNKEAVIMLSRPRRIYEDQYWDGDLKSGDKVIIIHDVIYSGDGIVDCIGRISGKCTILGVFALYNRKESNKNNKTGKAEIERTGTKVFSAFDIDDDIIEKWLNEEG